MLARHWTRLARRRASFLRPPDVDFAQLGARAIRLVLCRDDGLTIPAGPRPSQPKETHMLSKPSLASQAQKLQQGVKKHLGKVKAVTLGGESYSPSQINAALQTLVDGASDLDTKKAAFHGAVEAQNKALASARPVMQGLASYVYLTYGNANEVLADFGLSPRKKRQATVETKAQAIKKAAATRAAGGTKGKRENGESATTAPATIPPASGVTPNAPPASTPAPAKASGSGS
jgi:hypothetical protein